MNAADAADSVDRKQEIGIPPPGFRLPAATRLGPVRFQIADLDRSARFYRDVLGLEEVSPLQEDDTDRHRVALGAGGEPLIELVERPGTRPVRPHSRLGLYHVAILLPDRRALARFVHHAAEQDIRLGMADHLVSEAVYLHDPDGLGLEVYADRPRTTWTQRGPELRMATDPLDVEGLLREAGSTPWKSAPAGTTVGHVHLHVGDVDGASAFYHEALGFDKIVWSYPGALFMSAGAYHHHLGTNVWARGAEPAGEDDAQLLEWTIRLPSAADLAAARRSMEDAGYVVEVDDETRTETSAWTAADPWGTSVRLEAG